MANTSKSICFLCTFLLCVCHVQYFCSGRDNISAGNWITDNGAEIVSAGNIFRMGFFTLNGSTGKDRKYVGIWYSDSPQVIVWVANRIVPIPSDVSGSFGIDMERGNLKVSDSGNTRTYFSTNVRPPLKGFSRTAKLDDTGNLKLTDDVTGQTLWESFKNPTDTFLPGMKMDTKLNLTSWKSDEDPAPGNFSFRLDEEFNGGYSILKFGIIIPYWKSGNESTNSFISKQMSIPASLLLSNTTKNTGKGVSSLRSRLFMQSNGEIKYLNWDTVNKKWLPSWSEPKGPCSFFKACGSFATCSPHPHNHSIPLCTCWPGFEPNNEENWKSGDISEGCKKKSSKCTPSSNTSFVQLNVTMVRSNTPEFQEVEDSDKCSSICQTECKCQAYSNSSNTKNNRISGCWFWFGDLSDIQEEGSDGNHVIFIRVDPPSDLGSSSSTSVGKSQKSQGSSPQLTGDPKRKMKSSNLRGVIIATSVIFAVALLCCITCIFYRRVVAKGKDRNNKENQAPRLHDNEYLMDQDGQFGEDDKKDIDVPFFEFASIVDATDNFAEAYKLG